MDAQMDAEKQMDTSAQAETTIIQAIHLVDNLDKEVNTYAMKARELYGRHFPELDRILQDNILYAKSVKLMGDRVNASKIDFSQILSDKILSDKVEAELKEAAVISMGTEVSDLDLKNIMDQCDQVLSLSQCRALLSDYLKSRMTTFAPNLTTMVGELVGARLIARKGGLVNLAKQPGSTIQILGAEETLSRALETNQPIPKPRLIYCAPLVDQSSQPNTKGRFCRSLAAKTALAVRYDAFRDGPDNRMGLENRAKLIARLADLKDRESRELSKSAEPKITSAKTCNPAADSTLGQALDAAVTGNAEEKDTKKEKKRKKKSSETEEQTTAVEEKKEKKKKKKKSDEDGEGENAKKEKKKEEKEEKVVEDGEKSKKKKRKHKDVEEEEEAEQTPSKKKDKTKTKKTDKEEKVVEDGEKSKKKKTKHADVEEQEEAAEQAQSKKKEKKKKKKSERNEEKVSN